VELGNLDIKVLEQYLKPFKQQQINTLILACTHYGEIKKQISQILGNKVNVVAQEDILPNKLKKYLVAHKELRAKLESNHRISLQLTKSNPRYASLAHSWFGQTKIQQIRY